MVGSWSCRNSDIFHISLDKRRVVLITTGNPRGRALINIIVLSRVSMKSHARPLCCIGEQGAL